MGFWIYMTAMACLIPATLIFFGIKFSKKAPNEINYLFGYRTKRSMQNQDTWQFAHNYVGGLMKKFGAVTLCLSLAVMPFTLGRGEDLVGTVGAVMTFVPLIFITAAIIMTEKQLKINFDEYGLKRRKDENK